jgi:HEPN domain-containing protein
MKHFTRWSGIPALPLALALVVAGCEQSPTTPVDSDDAALAALVVAHWDQLPSVASLEDRTVEATSQGAAHGEARALLGLASGLSGEASALRASGARAQAENVEADARALVAEAAISAFGPAFAQAVVADVAGVLDELERFASSRGASRAAMDALGAAATDLEEAARSLGAGADGPALAAAVAASETLRTLAPEQLARRWVMHATRLLERATRAAGADPEPPVSAWLQAAGQMLGQAISAHEAGNWNAAIAHAKNSAEKSWQVLAAVLPPPPAPDLEALAVRALDQAAELLARAEEKAGATPPDPVAEALDQARRLLGEARAAYDAEDYREAIRSARASAALSLRVIRILSFGSRG